MSNRIITPNGLPAGGGPPERPQTIKERLDQCLEDWHHHRRDKAFIGSLNAIAMLASGIHGLNQIMIRLEQQNQALHQRVAELEKPTTDG